MKSKLACLLVALLYTSLAAAPALGDKIIRNVRLRTPLTPKLQRVVDEAFPKDPGLKEYLEPVDPDADNRDDQDWPRFYGVFIDLADDNNPLAVFYIAGGGYCGSAGCPLEILRKQGGKWHKVGGGMAGSEMVYVLDRRDNGYHRLDIGGGPLGCPVAPLIWNGSEYTQEDTCEGRLD